MMTLVERIEEIIRAAEIEAGVAIWHIESDTRLDVNGDAQRDPLDPNVRA